MSREIKSKNITYTEGNVSQEHRSELNGHGAAILWFTGLSGAGKSTLAQAVEQALFKKGAHTYILDGDNIRFGLNRDLGFSPEDRTENIRRIGEVAKLMMDAGTICLTAFISPYIVDRKTARDITPEGKFIEVYTKCSLEECENRDPKGLYKKARAGEIPQFTGISAPYEAPENAELVVETDKHDVAACVEQVLAYLRKREILLED
ncbi:adenylyl-sulfate kinase [bacterium]|nr:adenylyl-sulfate kinase [bacterium]PJA75897.1 MAG: adenylyl-sulfate kinase [bacterium CG_4_9_14_3_um_filter_65_15]